MSVDRLGTLSEGGLSAGASEDRFQARVDLIYVPHRPYGRWAATTVAAAVLATLIWSVASNPYMAWGVVGQYLFSPLVLRGLLLTCWLTVVTTALGLLVGIVLAIMRMSPNRIVSTLSGLYVWFFRGTPLLVQLIMLFNLASLFPYLSLSIPFGPTLVRVSTNAVITPYVAAILGLGLHEAAYMAEIVRGGLLSVDEGQRRAADALGMGSLDKFWHVVLPQAMPAVIPPIGNQLIGMLKMTSLVSVIALADLLYSVQLIYSRNYQTVPLLLVACFWYLVATSTLSVFQRLCERRFGRGLTQR